MRNKPLPNDVATLQALLEQQQEQNDFLRNQLEQLQQKLDNLLHILYGQSSEKRSKKKSEATEKSDDDSDPHPPAGENKSTKKKPKRKPLPDNLPRVREEYDIAEEDKTCKSCGSQLKKSQKKSKSYSIARQYNFFFANSYILNMLAAAGNAAQKCCPSQQGLLKKARQHPDCLLKSS